MKLSSAQSATERALAAIVLTDAVSFSARMSVDEEGTLALIQRDLNLISELCARYGGQVLKSTGDGLLMSFYSAVQAVLCSKEIQKQLAKLAEGLPLEEYLQHRIGIHLGDVLFSHEDVLGNGVNIAARLQTKSAPGGICISQTVYDVVKARVDINVTPLGPLKLKNIQERVTAFQIPPFGQSATMVVSESSAQAGGIPQSPLAIATQALEQDSQIRRIKKLIFGTYQGVWENDPKVLAQFELLSLLEKLHQRHHTLISLEKALQAMASRLNHKEVYLAVTDTILVALEPVYYEAEDAASDSEKTSTAQMREYYREVAHNLSRHADRLRIKKLLYALVHTVWENDPATLSLHTLDDLVADVHQIAPTEADLTYHLERIVKRLNRQNRYTQLALMISEAFHPLYGTSIGFSDKPQEETSLDVSDGSQTMMMGDETSFSEENPTSLTRWEQVELSLENTDAQTDDQRPADGNSDTASAPTKSRDRANLFDLRLEIMRYTNPLRAKILLLSTVRSPFASTPQDWITLKSKSLDDLVQDTFQYCKTFADLESKLTIMCHCVDNVGENIQTAGAILQAMKPFYP
ncbi:adenylate/guanylate cyclase domain-containing protein [Oscillatoria sp. CS-180]|uniref:adenylate/guanylate cyclase domain-containing protein n=1 Tax=Oscillatoria sp. CS-180 TaxID=3021720 RepID=UPI00232EAA1B|nr:adenylate/guanylate cyclase domain-containing protein [Oscillatoria sp. CS-180]MDB9528448.1 adenylate/guanylate cyclase domain-containing protein [Oscillatoria sp. CS-180]